MPEREYRCEVRLADGRASRTVYEPGIRRAADRVREIDPR